MSNHGDSNITRRNVFRGGIAGATAVGAAVIAGVSDARAAVRKAPATWDMDADVVCVGYGGAGAAAAITAHDAGARVLIIEKMAQGGGNTAVSSGGVLCPTDGEGAATYLTGLCNLGYTEFTPDLVRLYVEMGVKCVDWLTGLKEGTRLEVYGGAGYPNVPGASSIKKYSIQGRNGGGPNLWALYAYAVEEQRKIRVLTETPAKRLVTNEDGEVIGLIAVQKGKEVAIRARRGVILTTGGYEFDDSIKKNHFNGYPIVSVGSPGNAGDGIRMAQQLGAEMWHWNGVSTLFALKVPEYESAYAFNTLQPGIIYVDRNGHRFRDEKSLEAHVALLAVNYFDTDELRYPRIPCYAIFGEDARTKGPINMMCTEGYIGKRSLYKWSQDNSAEIEKGWIRKGATIVELAGQIKVDAANLEATIARWNEDIKKGEDTLFHRPINAPGTGGTRPLWSASIEKPPFYAIELYPGLMNTTGGPRRNTKAQILDVFDQPISRLYSAGELGSMWGLIYPGAGSNAESIIFGQIAGKYAAAETPST